MYHMYVGLRDLHQHSMPDAELVMTRIFYIFKIPFTNIQVIEMSIFISIALYSPFLSLKIP